MASTQAKARLVEELQKIICLDDILDDMIVAFSENLQPEDVFDESVLAGWAEENGYAKSE